MKRLRVSILDRYLVEELGGPFLFGLAAFTLVFVAGQLLNISRLISEEHAAVWAAAKYFLYTLPQTLSLTFPMSMLLAVLLAMTRLSGDFEITAIRAGGTSLYRIAAPLVFVGLIASFVALIFQEAVVPVTSARAEDILRHEIEGAGTDIVGNQVVRSVLPNGDLQVTYALGFDSKQQELQNTSIEVYRGDALISLLIAPRARYHSSTWEFYDARAFALSPSCCAESYYPVFTVDIGADPVQLLERTKQPESMSRGELASLLHSADQLTDRSRYALLLVTYDSKLARPFASLAFTLLAIPLGIRPQRTSGSAGFGISVAIVFAFYVITTVCLAIGRSNPHLSFVMAWLPNVLLLGCGLWLLRRSAQV